MCKSIYTFLNYDLTFVSNDLVHVSIFSFLYVNFIVLPDFLLQFWHVKLFKSQFVLRHTLYDDI